MNRRTRHLIVAMASVALATAACGDDNKVGSDELTNFKEGTTSTRLGQTTTTAPPETTTTTGGSTGTTGKATTTTSLPISAQIKILPTSAGNYFDPRDACAVVNTVARWTNTDSVPRGLSVAGQRSGPIAPNATWDFKLPGSPTQINYGEDESVPGYRPFATGTLKVYPTQADAQRCA